MSERKAKRQRRAARKAADPQLLIPPQTQMDTIPSPPTDRGTEPAPETGTETNNKEPRHTHDLLSIPWTPFVQCERDPRDPDSEIFRNSRYQVHIRRLSAKDGGPDLLHLSYRRLDRNHLVPYRDKMRIKDELVGPEYEGVELLPARSREVDTSNQFHAWIIDSSSFRFPFGFTQRLVTEVALDGAKQEPWPPDERPADCLSEEELKVLLQREKGKRR